MLASKAVITATDSGGPLEFIEDGVSGLIAEPTPKDLARALDSIWEDRAFTKRLGKHGRERYESYEISWSNVVDQLLHA